jgi:hypothetical protein
MKRGGEFETPEVATATSVAGAFGCLGGAVRAAGRRA